MTVAAPVHPDGVRQRARGRTAPIVIVMLGLIILVAGPLRRCVAQSEDLSGRIVDKAGAGVSGVSVWAIGGAWESPEVVAKATTDDQGRFLIPRAWGSGGPASLHYLGLFARAADGRIGWQGTVWRNSPDPIRIQVSPGGEALGRMVDQNGRPIAGAEVRPVIIARSSDPKSGQDYVRLSTELAGPFRTATAADGSFVLKGIPPGAAVQAMIAAAGFGTPRISWDTAKPVLIALDGRLGQIKGRLRPPDARGLSGQFSLSLRRAMTEDSPAPGSFRMLDFRTLSTGQDGTFQFNDLQPGRYQLDAQAGPSTPFAARPVQDIEVGPSAVAQVEVALERLLTITGRVVDAQTGQGVAGIYLRSSFVDDRNYYQLVGQAQTGADGRYTIAARPGKPMQVQPTSLPKTYLGLRPSECPKLEVQADRIWPDLKLTRAMELDGLVVDAAGRPVVGAEVFVVAPDPTGFFAGDAGPTRTGPGGTFRLQQLDPDDTLPLRARTKEATTDGAIVIRPREVKGPLRLTIDPKFAFRVRGLVADRAGKRVAGAKVTLWWGRRYVSEKLDSQGTGISSGLESYTTTEAGWFVFRDLWPGDQYKVTVEAPGHSKAETPEVTGKAGETHDYGRIALVNTGGHLAGRVVGSDGRPVAGVSVFNRGDGPEPVQARTDEQGRFRLERLYPGVKYVFVRRDGYRFTGVKSEGDADDLAITLLKAAEPPPAWKPGATAGYEDQRGFARWVLTRIWEKYGARANQNGAFVCILDMARIDPALALQWSAESAHRYDGRVRQAAAEELADTDAPGALELLAQDRDRGSQYTVQQLAERFAPTDRAKALLFAEEAAVRARALDQPDRSFALAQAGAVLAQVGRAEAGRKLIDEAAESAARLGSEGRQAYYRGLVAQALAPFDLKRAQALIEPCKAPNDKDRYRAFLASALARTDPARAVALADELPGSGTYGELIKTEVAYEIGAERPDEAVRIIEGMKGHAAEKMQAEAFGWLAVAVARRDRARAFALIDRGLAIPIDKPEPFQSWVYFGAAMAPAVHIAACARQVGYPDMESVIMRVMTTRPSDSGRGAFHDPAMQIQSAAFAAVPLALVDPGAARVMLQQIEERSGLDAAALSKIVRDRWLTAWALVDLKKAEALFEAELAALEGAKELNLQSTGFFKMVELLATPPHRREAAVDGEYSAAWHPGHRL
jgi:hypothetical protein